MPAEPSKTEQLKALHRRVIEELWNKGNLDVIDEHVHPELQGRRQAEGLNVEDAKRIVGEFRQAFPDLRVTIDHQIAEGDELATFSTFHGTHRGEFRGVSPTGNAVRVSSSCHTRFQDGKVVEETVLFDQEGMLSQLRQR